MDDSTAQPQGLSPALRAQGDEGLSTVIDEILTAQSTALSPIGQEADVVNALSTIKLAWRASDEACHTLANADSWVKEVTDEGAGIGNLITARAHVEQAMAQALRIVGLCAEATAELRLITSLHREAIADEPCSEGVNPNPPRIMGGEGG